MIARTVVGSVLVCFFAVSLAFAQAPPRWKFAKGQVFEVERALTQKQTVDVKDASFKQTRQSTWNIRLEVREPHEDGYRITATLVKIAQQMDGVAIDEMIDPKLAEKMQGCSFMLLVTPIGQVKEMKGYEEFLKKLAEKDKSRLKALQSTFPEVGLKDIFADLFGPLPDKKVAVGDSWERTYVEPISYFGSLRSMVRYTYEGPQQQTDRIVYAIQTKYELPKEELTGLFRIVKGEVQTEKAAGTITFDATAGHLVTHQRSMLLRGKLMIETMDRQQAMEFTSENEVKIRVKQGEPR